MDPLWYLLVAALAALLGVSIGWLLGKATGGSGSGGSAGSQWPDVICDPKTGKTARTKLREIFNLAAGPNGPTDPDIRNRILNAAVACEFTHEYGPWHQPHTWSTPQGGCTKVCNAYKKLFPDPAQPLTAEDWVYAVDELEHNP